MAFSFIAANSATGTGVTSLACNLAAGTAAGDLLVIAYAFENVAASSGPWIIPNVGQLNPNGIGPANSWQQACWQAPSGTGTGIEVWAAIYSSGTAITGNFAASQNVSVVTCTYRGEYNPTGNILGAPPRLAPTAQVTGHQPASPSVLANNGELVIAVAGDTMTASNFGTPSGFTNRVDVTRGAAGTVETTIADRVATLTGATGPITFPNNASSATAKGSTATLVFQAVPTVAGSGGIINAGMPEDLDIGAGYTIRVTALDATTGNQVSGVNIDQVVLTATQVSGTPAELETGDWFLMPGPGA